MIVPVVAVTLVKGLLNAAPVAGGIAAGILTGFFFFRYRKKKRSQRRR